MAPETKGASPAVDLAKCLNICALSEADVASDFISEDDLNFTDFCACRPSSRRRQDRTYWRRTGSLSTRRKSLDDALLRFPVGSRRPRRIGDLACCSTLDRQVMAERRSTPVD
jgi:hypothetical protein